MFQLLLIVGVVAILVYIFRSHLSSYDYSKKRTIPSDSQSIIEEYGTVVALMAKVAKADGHVSELEAELISNIFDDIVSGIDDGAQLRAKLKEIYNFEKDGGHPVKELAQNFLEYSDSYKRHKILEFLINLAFIDGSLSHHEERVIEEVAYIFKISASNYKKILESYRAFYARRASSTEMSSEECYKTLGCNKEDSLATVKKNYRKLVKEHHPDIVRGRGESEAMIEKANEKLQSINEAYECVKKQKS